MCPVMLLLLLLAFYSKLSKLHADVSLSSVCVPVFFTGSLGFGPKELWGKCHPATLQMKAKRGARQHCCGGQDSHPTAASTGYCLSGWLLRGHRLFESLW